MLAVTKLELSGATGSSGAAPGAVLCGASAAVCVCSASVAVCVWAESGSEAMISHDSKSSTRAARACRAGAWVGSLIYIRCRRGAVACREPTESCMAACVVIVFPIMARRQVVVLCYADKRTRLSTHKFIYFSLIMNTKEL